MKEKIRNIWNESLQTKSLTLTDENIEVLEKMAVKMTDCLINGNKILTCGNGGSACDATHMAEELLGRFEKERKAFSVISLVTDFATITAVSNDYGFENIFKRQIEGIGKEKDILFVFTTSGNSVNIIEACKMAKNKKMNIFGFLGNDGGKVKKFTDLSFIVPVKRTARIQEVHVLGLHILCDLIETSIINRERKK